MKPALLLLLVPALALGQAQDKKEEEKKQEPPKPLILRLDQLSPAERSGLVVTEEPKKPGDNLPELGGKPSTAYDNAGVRGSGTESASSPYPVNTQQGR